MSTPLLKVEKPGLMTTIQDLGRTGYQQYGIVVSGAMDSFAVRVANILVGNEESDAALEVTMMGPHIEFLADTVLAIGGADLSASLDDKRIPPWKSVYVKKGQVLSFGKPEHGMRAYVAVNGGIEVEPLLGSKSTYVKAKMGGIEGRELQKGDVLNGRPSSKEVLQKVAGLVVSRELLPDYISSQPIRVIGGPDETAFTKSGLETFYSGEYECTRDVDRMGYRLLGPVIEHKETADILSDAVTMGTIQVPSNGQPIILLADRQTSGGYARIGTVISVDLPRLAQQAPGGKIRFQSISIEKAEQLLRNREKALFQLSLGVGSSTQQ
ncbi:biotin-dependent carboxyltransferase family protein [Salipaludibacillus daqingensis]|uniref:5-oxoprolinase subunit C family protein n=1 Tax=Salipaludibacillus daqingensis TaxID=3041001 RepID=UPI00247343EE|nr:biotin-dependent carboxyltransferase family protein [Salipaludibacillus daqingensis]